MSNRGCPGLTVSLFRTWTFSTLPETSAATGTTNAWTRACDVYGVRRSETKYHVRLATIRISTTIEPTREPFPGCGAAGGGAPLPAALPGGAAPAGAGADASPEGGVGPFMVWPLRKA